MDTGYFIIADITGYTAFMTQSELEHAHDILTSLFDVLLEHLKPPLTISNFQGDAILTYVTEAALGDGSNLLDTIEAVYYAFALTLEQMRNNTTCTCQACANMAQLDLKFFVHYGQFVIQDLHGRKEISGSDVILIHRLLKNNVTEETGIRAYALLTRRAVDALGISANAMVPYGGEYEHLGHVDCVVHDLGRAWESERAHQRIVVPPEDVVFESSLTLPLGLEEAWQFMTRPDIRTIFMAADAITIRERPGGRVGRGARYHCAHGSRHTDQFVLDWRPYEYFTTREESHMGPLNPILLTTTRFVPLDGTTRVTYQLGRGTDSTALKRALIAVVWFALIRPMMRRQHGPALEARLRDQIAADRAAGLMVAAPSDALPTDAVELVVDHLLGELGAA